MPTYYQETFTTSEVNVLERFFTNTDLPVFALINLPEVVKGALFARYSRSSKSLRRLFLDEFVENPETGIDAIAESIADQPMLGMDRAEQLYKRVFFDYGDDSVAQLGGAHLACEQASNLLTKVLEWGRLAAYLEQSTRYIRYDAPLGDRYRFFTPDEITDSSHAPAYQAYMTRVFDTYSSMVGGLIDEFGARHPRTESDSKMVWTSTIRAKACDTVRGLLPVATLSNVGMYGTGQAYEMALIRMQASPLSEVREYGRMMLAELRKVIPSFLTRVDLENRGVLWSRYLADTKLEMEQIAAELPGSSQPGASVTLTDWDPDGEIKTVAAALYSVSELSDGDLQQMARKMTTTERTRVLETMVGDRHNRRHKPGRAMERTSYRFDIKCDIGAFRDLQRHRLMTLEWQRFTTRLGYDIPSDVSAEGLEPEWVSLMDQAGELYETIRHDLGAEVAQYVVPFAYNVRFIMDMNAREAFHLLELRSQPAGHPAYRTVAQQMHQAIQDVAGHAAIAGAMQFVDYSVTDLERLESERKAELKRTAANRS